jgi:hypothetical protein
MGEMTVFHKPIAFRVFVLAAFVLLGGLLLVSTASAG